jgi:hypothetical protein
MNPLDGLLNFGSKVIDKIWPDPVQAEQAKAKLIELQMSGELAKMANDAEVFKSEQEAVTGRWNADMGSDSALSKNVRPMVLIAILSGYFGFAIASIFGYNANQSYVELLGQWGMLVMSAYFGGRTLEKIMAKKSPD